MSKDNRQAEDVAAVLQGLKKCTYCDGSGRARFNKDQTCFACGGRRWVRYVTGDYWVDNNRVAWVYAGTSWIRVGNV